MSSWRNRCCHNRHHHDRLIFSLLFQWQQTLFLQNSSKHSKQQTKESSLALFLPSQIRSPINKTIPLLHLDLTISSYRHRTPFIASHGSGELSSTLPEERVSQPQEEQKLWIFLCGGRILQSSEFLRESPIYLSSHCIRCCTLCIGHPKIVDTFDDRNYIYVHCSSWNHRRKVTDSGLIGHSMHAFLYVSSWCWVKPLLVSWVSDQLSHGSWFLMYAYLYVHNVSNMYQFSIRTWFIKHTAHHKWSGHGCRSS